MENFDPLEEDYQDDSHISELDVVYSHFDDPNKIILTIEAKLVESMGTNQQTNKKNRSRSRTELEVLPLFKDKNNRPPKKEYLRIKVIRAFKRAMRESLEYKMPFNKLHSVNTKKITSIDAWNAFANFCREHQEHIKNISKTESGPKTDGKTKKRGSLNLTKSHNDTFCKEFFEARLVRILYSKYLDTVFSDISCMILQKKFEYSPHSASSLSSRKACSEECEEKWKLFESYLRNDMLKDIGLNQEEGGVTD